MVWHIIKFGLSFLLPTFYKRIQSKGSSIIQRKGPVIIAMNHPNAFTDPIVLTYATFSIRLRYLARGDAFKPGLISTLLEWIGIVPIYRMRDGGKEGLKKNDETYRRVNELLAKNSKIIVFAEGLCVQERRLRPLKKGVSRMVFGAYEHLRNDDLCVVPVGVNYSKPDKFRSTVFYNIGEPIFVKDFKAVHEENQAKANNQFLQTLEPKMKELITHINNPLNDKVVEYLEILCKDDVFEKGGWNKNNLHHDFLVTKQITELVNNTSQVNQAGLDEFNIQATNYFNELKNYGLRDWLLNPNYSSLVNYTHLVVRVILLVVASPVYLTGLVGNFFQLYFIHWLTKKIIKNVEFYSSIAIGLGMFVFPVIYAIWFLIINSVSNNIGVGLAGLFVFAMSGWFSLYYHPYLLKTLGIFRVLNNKSKTEALKLKRKTLLDLINKF
jgi:glycerol-3-phosphate O-acyltransferase / dihydroxyacetone phosphate acyltransferase